MSFHRLRTPINICRNFVFVYKHIFIEKGSVTKKILKLLFHGNISVHKTVCTLGSKAMGSVDVWEAARQSKDHGPGAGGPQVESPGCPAMNNHCRVGPRPRVTFPPQHIAGLAVWTP